MKNLALKIWTRKEIFWLYVLFVSRMRFRVNSHSIVAWMSGKFLRETFELHWISAYFSFCSYWMFFASLIDIFIGIASSSIGSKTLVINAGTTKNKSMINANKKKILWNNIVNYLS